MKVSFKYPENENAFMHLPEKSPINYDGIEIGKVINITFDKETGFYEAEWEIYDQYLELVIDLVRGNCVSVKEGEQFTIESKPFEKE